MKERKNVSNESKKKGKHERTKEMKEEEKEQTGPSHQTNKVAT